MNHGFFANFVSKDGTGNQLRPFSSLFENCALSSAASVNVSCGRRREQRRDQECFRGDTIRCEDRFLVSRDHWARPAQLATPVLHKVLRWFARVVSVATASAAWATTLVQVYFPVPSPNCCRQRRRLAESCQPVFRASVLVIG